MRFHELETKVMETKKSSKKNLTSPLWHLLEEEAFPPMSLYYWKEAKWRRRIAQSQTPREFGTGAVTIHGHEEL